MQTHDDCASRSIEIEKTLLVAESKWQKLEAQLEEAEESFLLGRLESWKKWFALEEEELRNWSEFGFRHTVRCRIFTLLLIPIVEKMQHEVDLVPSGEENEEASQIPRRSANHVLGSVLDYWQRRVKPTIVKARSADNQLTKKINKTEKDERAKGVVALGMQDTKKVAALKRERPQIWEATHKVLDKIATPAKQVSTFMEAQLSAEVEERLLSAVPVVASRTLCDWYFQRCLVDYEQLDTWWSNTKATLQSKERLWQCLMEKEGILIRRIDAGIEDIGGRRRTYSVHANFGGSEIEVMSSLNALSGKNDSSSDKLEDKLHLLATVVLEMTRRLKAFRDAALWRVIETAQSIHKELCEEGAEMLPWQAADASEGVEVFFQLVDWGEQENVSCLASQESKEGAEGTGFSLENEDALANAVIVYMGCLERFGAVTTDLRDFFHRGEASLHTDGICQTLGHVMQGAADLNEDLLCLLDDPSIASAQAWLQQWENCFGNADVGHRLESAMVALPLRRDSDLPPDQRRVRRRWLLLMRGLQVFLSDEAVRINAIGTLAKIVDPTPPALKSQASHFSRGMTQGAVSFQEVDADAIIMLSTPPSPRLVAPLISLGGGYTYRPPARQNPWPGVEAPDHELAVTTVEGSEGFITPWRPDAPAAIVHDALDGVRTPSPKFVDGQYVPLRPNSADKRLPPLSPGGGGGARCLNK